MKLSELTKRELAFLAGRAEIGRDVIMKTALEPHQRREFPVFTATRAADILGKVRQTVGRAIQELSIGTKVGSEQQVKHSLTQEDLWTLSEHFNGPVQHQPCVTVAVINQKGGVAKTTTAVHLAHYAALLGYRVLAVDADSQASLSSLLGVAPDVEIEEDDTLFPILTGEHLEIEKLIRKTSHFKNLDFLPSCLALAAANELSYERQLRNTHTEQLAAKHGFKFERDNYVFYDRLSRALKRVAHNYDLIVIDCPPHISAATYNVIAAADMALVPASVSILDMASTFRFIEWVDTIAPMLNGLILHRIKFLATNFDSSKAATEAFSLMSTILGAALLKNQTLRSSEVMRAGGALRSIYEVTQPMGSREAWGRACESMDKVNREILGIVDEVWSIKRQDALRAEEARDRLSTERLEGVLSNDA